MVGLGFSEAIIILSPQTGFNGKLPKDKKFLRTTYGRFVSQCQRKTAVAKDIKIFELGKIFPVNI